MFRLSYLRSDDSFFGFNSSNTNYHLPGEGNIRGFLNQNEIAADAGASISGEIFMINKRIDGMGYLDDRSVSLELAAFVDAGVFYHHGNVRNLADVGLGFDLKWFFQSTTLFENRFSVDFIQRWRFNE